MSIQDVQVAEPQPRLARFSREPVDLRTYAQVDDVRMGVYGKPQGLWISVETATGYSDDGWHYFCRSDYTGGMAGVLYETTLRLTPGHNVLILSDAAALDAFTEKYGRPFNLPLPNGTTFPMGSVIDWGLVSQDYEGVLIAPYVWSRRMAEHTRWYYGWDCASGCIWDPAHLEIVESRPFDPATLNLKDAD